MMANDNSKPGKRSKGQRKSSRGITRRDFLKGVGMAGGLVALGNLDHLAALAAGEEEETPVEVRPLPKRALGSMGFNASVLGMGGTHICDGAVEDGIAILDRALELGITYYDSASQYGSGESERRYGAWLERLQSEGRRNEVFFATKTLQRAYTDAKQEIAGSVERLRGSRIDLLQLHAIIDEGTLRVVMSRNGSLKAAEEAKRAGQVRHIGITNHRDPEILLKALDEFPFDSVLVDLGIADRMRRPFADILPQLVEKNISIVAMKVFAEGNLPGAGADLERCLHYTLSLPVSTAIIGMKSPAEVEQNVSWVHSYEGMTEEEIQALEEEIGGLVDVNTFWWKG